MEMMQQIISMIGSTGFPIVVTIYLLMERKSTMEEFTKAVRDLTTSITLLNEYIRGDLKNDTK